MPWKIVFVNTLCLVIDEGDVPDCVDAEDPEGRLVSASSDVPTCVAVLREMKKEGKVRYIGVHDLTPPPYPTGPVFARLESIMRDDRNSPIDFVGTDYSAGWRSVE